MRIRRTATAMIMIAAVTVPAAVTGGIAYAQGSSPVATAAAKKPAPVKEPVKKPTPPKKVKIAFQASGTISAVDAGAGTITVAVRSGTKDVRGKSVTMSVPAGATIVLNGKKVTVSALSAGIKVSLTGTRVDAAYTVARIQASGKAVAPKPTPSSSAPTTDPSAPPTTAPTSAPTTAPTTAPTVAPTTAPTTAPTVAPTTAPTVDPTPSAPAEEPGDEPADESAE
jgi:hypothetical protein